MIERQLPIEVLEQDYEEIVSMDFSSPNAHIAVTHAIQGASTGCDTPLMMKSKIVDTGLSKALNQISVNLSFEDFLRKFYGLYHGDAEELALLLGFKTEEEFWEEARGDRPVETDDTSYSEQRRSYVEERFQIIQKSEKGFDALTSDERMALVDVYKAVSEYDAEAQEEPAPAQSSEASTDEVGVEEKLETEEDSSEDVKTSSSEEADEQETNVSDTELELKKAAEEMTSRLADLEAREASLIKANEEIADKLKVFEDAEEQRLEKSLNDFTGRLSFVDGEDKGKLVTFLKGAQTVEGVTLVTELLNKAQAKIDSIVDEMGKEVGVEGVDEEEVDTSFEKAATKALLDQIERLNAKA